MKTLPGESFTSAKTHRNTLPLCQVHLASSLRVPTPLPLISILFVSAQEAFLSTPLSQTNNMVLRVSRPIVQNTLLCVLTLPCDLLPELLLISQPFLPYILLPPLSLRSFCLFSLPHLRLPDYLFSCPFFAFTLVIISELWLLPRHAFRAQISSRKTCPSLH